MQRPRLTTRRLMAVVAMVAVVLGVWVMKQRQAECLRRAEDCASHERLLLAMAAWCERIVADDGGRGRRSRGRAVEVRSAEKHGVSGRPSASRAETLESARAEFWARHQDFATDSAFAPEWAVTADSAAQARRLAARYASERLRYSRAARYPWVSIPPDPPPSN